MSKHAASRVKIERIHDIIRGCNNSDKEFCEGMSVLNGNMIRFCICKVKYVVVQGRHEQVCEVSKFDCHASAELLVVF